MLTRKGAYLLSVAGIRFTPFLIPARRGGNTISLGHDGWQGTLSDKRNRRLDT